MTNRTLTALFCAALLVPLVLGGFLVRQRYVARAAREDSLDAMVGTVTVVMHQPGYYQRLDSIARDSTRRDSLARHRTP